MQSVRVSVVIVQDGRVVLIRQRRRALSRWVLPGGKIPKYEPIDASAIREVREATGLEITLGPLLGVFEINDRWRQHIHRPGVSR